MANGELINRDYPLVMCDIAIEHGPLSSLIYPLNMVIFNSYVKLPGMDSGLACFSFPQNCLSNSSKIEFATKHVWNSVDTRCEKQLPQGPIATRNDATTPNEQNLFSIGPFKAEPIKTYNLLSHSTLLHSTCAFLRNTYFLSTYIQILYIYIYI